MFNRRLLGLTLAVGLVLGLSSMAMANIPDAGQSAASSPGGTLYITPSGGGENLSDATVTATISVTVNDANGNPIQNYPFQDIWPGSAVPGDINLCNGGAAADGNTNAAGQTTISGTLAGGGWTQAGVRVFLAGVAITGTGALSIDINSPDITGDLIVDLADIGPFSDELNNQTATLFRADYFDDGLIDLADIGIFSTWIGDICQ